MTRYAKQEMWAQATLCHITRLVISHYWKTVFAFCNLHSDVKLGLKFFKTKPLWNKKS